MMASDNNSAHYRAALIAYAMRRKGWNENQTATAAKIHPSSVNAALAGNLKTTTKLRKLADTLGIVWKHLFDTDLPESRFPRAVVNGKKV